MANENENADPFAGFVSEKAVDGIPVETKKAEVPKGTVPEVPEEDEEPNPLAAFSDHGDDDGDEEDASDDDDGSEFDDGADDEDDDEDDDEQSSEDDDEERPRKRSSAQKRIAELTKARREAERRAAELEEQLARFKSERSGDMPKDENKSEENAPEQPAFEVKDVDGKVISAPDPKNYKYGEVDSAYLRDVVNYQTAYARSKVEHEAEQVRQQQAAEQRVQELRESWEKTIESGVSRYDDFEETVLAAGDRGDYDLTQFTFEQAASSEFGADILYHLATNPKTASKVARMSEIEQARYLGRLEAAIETSRKGGDKGKQKRKAPGAAPPPNRTRPRGKGGKFVNPARSENFGDFEAHWRNQQASQQR